MAYLPDKVGVRVKLNGHIMQPIMQPITHATVRALYRIANRIQPQFKDDFLGQKDNVFKLACSARYHQRLTSMFYDLSELEACEYISGEISALPTITCPDCRIRLDAALEGSLL